MPSPPPARARLQDPDFALREGGSGKTADSVVPLGSGPECFKFVRMRARGKKQATKRVENCIEQCVSLLRGEQINHTKKSAMHKHDDMSNSCNYLPIAFN